MKVRFDLIKDTYLDKNELAYEFGLMDKQVTLFSQSHPLYDTVNICFRNEDEFRDFYFSWDEGSGVEWKEYLETHLV